MNIFKKLIVKTIKKNAREDYAREEISKLREEIDRLEKTPLEKEKSPNNSRLLLDEYKTLYANEFKYRDVDARILRESALTKMALLTHLKEVVKTELEQQLLLVENSKYRDSIEKITSVRGPKSLITQGVEMVRLINEKINYHDEKLSQYKDLTNGPTELDKGLLEKSVRIKKQIAGCSITEALHLFDSEKHENNGKLRFALESNRELDRNMYLGLLSDSEYKKEKVKLGFELLDQIDAWFEK